VSTGAWSALFVLGTVASLAGSYVLVTRLERLGERIGMSEALLGMVAALAADAPEITSAVVALSHGQGAVGAGVVVGSNVFNLAALLGLGALVAGRFGLHRKVVLLSGTVAVWVAVVCMLAVLGTVTPVAALVLVALVLVPYLLVLGMRPDRLATLPVPAAWSRWLTTAVHEEEVEIEEAVSARRGTWRDGVVAALMLVVVVVASTVITSLPNAVAAVYLAARGRGAAVLSTALNSNALNIAIGLLLPAAITGMGPRTGQSILVAGWYAGLTVVALAFAYRQRALTRLPGAVIIGGYLVFVGALIVSTIQGEVSVPVALVPALAVGAVSLLILARPTGSSAAPAEPLATEETVRAPLWDARRAWRASVALCLTVAAADAVTGHRVILMGLLALGPCLALLTGRWRRTAAVGGLAFGLGVLVGVPDQVFATYVQYTFLGAIAVVTATATTGAAVIEHRRGA
jgi:cation:H+ antiporter